MRNITQILLLSFLFVSLTSYETKETITSVIEKMNTFYNSKAVKMSLEVKYFQKDDKIEMIPKTTFTQYNNKYLSVNNNEIFLFNSKYNLEIQRETKNIYLTEVPSNFQVKQRRGMIDTKKILESIDGKSIKEVNDEYVIKFSSQLEDIEYYISKKDYHLKKYIMSYKGDSFYKKAEATYTLLFAKDKLKANYFSEKKYIKKSGNGYKGVGEYKDYKIVIK